MWLNMSETYSLRLPEGYDEYEGLSEAKGWTQGTLALSDGRQFSIYFVTPERLAQDAALELASEDFYFEQNLILVRATDRLSLQAAVEALIAAKKIGQLHRSQ